MNVKQPVVKNKLSVILSGLLVILFAISLLLGSKVVKIDENLKNKLAGKSSVTTDFNASNYADESWDSKVLPFIQDNAKDVTTVIEAITKDGVETAGGTLGKKNTVSWSFIVKGSGKVIQVQNQSRTGRVTLDIEPFDGKEDIFMQIGPVINGTAIRDVLDYMKFDDFKNQIEWSQVADAYNQKSYNTQLKSLQFTPGATIDFTGVMTANDSAKILTPVIAQQK
ncbi:DUF2291 family protein [Neobacillus sp. Marseille-QA0830]